jgi:hypothetical protein
MTKKLEEFFNLPASTDPEPEIDEQIFPIKTKEELFDEARQIYSSISTAEKVDLALPAVVDLDQHDQEMDDIAAKAVRTFEDLISLGGNVPDLHAGKIYEVAGQMLKTALDAKNAKTDRKLKMIELQLKKVRTEQTDSENGNGQRGGGTGADFDRNELLKYIVNGKSEKSDK